MPKHALLDEEDYAHHFYYIRQNPVKHMYVELVQDWPYSTCHRWVKQGLNPRSRRHQCRFKQACGHLSAAVSNIIEDHRNKLVNHAWR